MLQPILFEVRNRDIWLYFIEGTFAACDLLVVCQLYTRRNNRSPGLGLLTDTDAVNVYYCVINCLECLINEIFRAIG